MDPAPLECIVVDDGSTDGSLAIAQRAGIATIACGTRRGPAVARNAGARAARGEILLFVDSDVAVPADTLSRIRARFAEDPGRDAVIGSYDDQPGSADFVSQYRNLLHSFTHQGSREEASTFWTGCGAIRTDAFREHGGFSEAYDRPYLEDVELGLRLQRAGRRIWLDKGLLVKHLKKLTLPGTLKTDLFDRAIPWTLLILRFRSMPSDLNLKWSQRFSVLAASAGATAVAIGVPYAPGEFGLSSAAAAAATAVVLVALNRTFYKFLARRKGFWFAARALPLHWLYFLCGALGFGIALLAHGLRSRVPVADAAIPRDPGGVSPGRDEPYTFGVNCPRS